jgi:hypothetical protein
LLDKLLDKGLVFSMQVLGLAKKMKMIQEQVEREQREAKARIPKAQLLPYTTDYPIVSVVYFTQVQ